ncbi:Putative ribonuclease H protein At1g65750, partial [Linum perenne]
HALRDCLVAIATWSKLGFPTSSPEWSGNGTKWIAKGMAREEGLLFGVAAWMLWKARNDSIFAGTEVCPNQLAFKIGIWAGNVVDAFNRDARLVGVNGTRCWKEISWDPGPLLGATINTDGSVKGPGHKASAGGVIRDSTGKALLAFTMNLGTSTITRAEINGAITGLELAWDLGLRQVELQIDSQVAVSILTATEDPTNQFAAEVIRFRELKNHDWRVSIKHIYREANKVADFLADQGYEFLFGTHLFPLVHCNLSYLLRYDCMGISKPRLISSNE